MGWGRGGGGVLRLVENSGKPCGWLGVPTRPADLAKELADAGVVVGFRAADPEYEGVMAVELGLAVPKAGNEAAALTRGW